MVAGRSCSLLEILALAQGTRTQARLLALSLVPLQALHVLPPSWLNLLSVLWGSLLSSHRTLSMAFVWSMLYQPRPSLHDFLEDTFPESSDSSCQCPRLLLASCVPLFSTLYHLVGIAFPAGEKALVSGFVHYYIFSIYTTAWHAHIVRHQ